MKTMNLDKWTDKAVKKVKKMSNRQKIAMLEALDIVIGEDINYEVVHADIVEFWDELAEAYGIELIHAED